MVKYSEAVLNRKKELFIDCIDNLNKELRFRSGITKLIDIGALQDEIKKCRNSFDLISIGSKLVYDRKANLDEHIEEILYQYYCAEKAINLSIKMDNAVNKHWTINKDIFKRLDRTGLTDFIIDIDDISSIRSKQKLLGLYSIEGGLPDEYCVALSKSNNLVRVDNSRMETTWYFSIQTIQKGNESSLGIYSYDFQIVPSKLPMIYTRYAFAGYTDLTMKTETVKRVKLYVNKQLSSKSGAHILVVYKYDNDGVYRVAKDIKQVIDSNTIKDLEIKESLRDTCYVQVPQELRGDIVRFQPAQYIGCSLDRLINSCFYAIDKYISM